MTEARNKHFVNKSQCAVQLRRMRGHRQTVSVRVTNHSPVSLTPIIGLSSDGTTITDTIVGTTIVPEANCLMEIPAEDTNSVLFTEQYVFLYYSYAGDEDLVEIGQGLEYDLMQYEAFSLLFLYGNSCSVLEDHPIPPSNWVPVASPAGTPGGTEEGEEDEDIPEEEDARPCTNLLDSNTETAFAALPIACQYDEDTDTCDERNYAVLGNILQAPRDDDQAICRVDFDIEKLGTVTGTLNAYLYDATDCIVEENQYIPDVSENWLVKSSNVDISSLGARAWITFNFNEPYYCLTRAQRYAIVIWSSDVVVSEQAALYAYYSKTLDPGPLTVNKTYMYDSSWYCADEFMRYKVYSTPC